MNDYRKGGGEGEVDKRNRKNANFFEEFWFVILLNLFLYSVTI